jgi:hypothetical protein
MGLREELGGKLEEALNKLVDEKLSAEILTPLIVDLLNKQLGGLKDKIKADVIDLIDGEDDIA